MRAIDGDGKVPVMLGGEHTATIGAVRAINWMSTSSATRTWTWDELDGTPYSHGCVTRRVADLGG